MSDLVERLRKWVSYSNGIPSQPEICKEAADEIERLRAEVDRRFGIQGELFAARAEHDALRADAERYRWLRSSFRVARWDVKYWTGEFWDVMYGSTMDEKIDAALGGEGKDERR